MCHTANPYLFLSKPNNGLKNNLIEGTISYKHLSEKEKNYFLYWRSEFRQGRAREAALVYIILYIRELILLMDISIHRTSVNPAEKTLEELSRLWNSYSKRYPEFFASIPCWILDFTIIHHVSHFPEWLLDNLIPSLSCDRSTLKKSGGLLLDLFLHRKYIEENHHMQWNDFLPLLGKQNPDSETGAGRLLAAAGDEALNSIDGFLRKKYGKKLLEFFYPIPPVKHTFSCFEGLSDLGYSAYTAEWVSFSRHRPFLKFLTSLGSYLEYDILKKNDPGMRGYAPYLDPLWKYLSGLGKNIPAELAGINAGEDEQDTIDLFDNQGCRTSLMSINLEAEKISRLRDESDAVMEMLKVEKDISQNSAWQAPAGIDTEVCDSVIYDGSQNRGGSVNQAMMDFVESLGLNAQDCLDLLSQGKGKELETFARNRNSMAEQLIYEINEQFLRLRGDILIDQSLDEGPVIQEEYRDEVLWAITFRSA